MSCDDWTDGDVGFATPTDTSYDTSGTDEINTVRTNPYCTVITYRSRNSTKDGDIIAKYKEDMDELWRQRIEREELELEELRRISRYKEKVNIPIISQNVINKTMNRRMMNSRH
jgi:hypothetical protein